MFSVFTEETGKEFVRDLLGSLSSLPAELRIKEAEAVAEAAILRISKFLVIAISRMMLVVMVARVFVWEIESVVDSSQQFLVVIREI